MERFKKPPGSAIAALAALVIYAFAFQGSRGIWKGDEGRYTAAALEMLRLKSITHLQLSDSIPHYTKPPLTYAAVAAGIAAVGRNEWAARTPNALAFIGTCLLLFHLGRRVSPARPWLAPLAFAACPLVYASANIITTDMLLTFFETAAMAAFISAAMADSCTPRRTLAAALLGWILLSLAVLTKGPPALLCLVPLLVWLMAWRGVREAARRLHLLPGLIVLAILGFGWFAWVMVHNPVVREYWIHRELEGRVLGTVTNHNSRWYEWATIYGPALLAGALPWSVMLGHSAWTSRRQWTRSGWWKATLHSDPFRLLLLSWVILPFTLFCVFPSRQPLYLVPLFAPLALLAASVLDRHPFPLARRRNAVLLAAWLVFMAAARGCVAYMEHPDCIRPLAAALPPTARRPKSRSSSSTMSHSASSCTGTPSWTASISAALPSGGCPACLHGRWPTNWPPARPMSSLL